MKLWTLSVVALATSVAVWAQSSTSNQTPSELKVVALLDCEPVFEAPLNLHQQATYDALMKKQQQVELAHAPIEKIQPELNRLAKELESVVKQLVMQHQTDEGQYTQLKARQEGISDDMSDLIERHQADFASLELATQGIEQFADDFEQMLTPLLAGVTYDQVHIVTPSEALPSQYCDNASFHWKRLEP